MISAKATTMLRGLPLALLAGMMLAGARADVDPDQQGVIDIEAGRQFWAFQPLVESEPPSVERAGWSRNRIDSYVHARLVDHGLEPSPEADRRTLIRRLTFDLIGLPPTPEEVDAFLGDDSPAAYERLVDRLLASRHHGERWARMWLDLARYTDVRERWVWTSAQPYLYRDWVVRALNEDMPYDQFVKRQLATDLMPETGVDDLPALGFLGLSPVYHKELRLAPEVVKGIVAEEWEERIDTVGRTFLGLTIACARCHDHKSDPISMEDYYALAGVFASIRRADLATVPEDLARAAAKARAEVKKREDEIKRLKEQKEKPPQHEEELAVLRGEIEEIKRATPQYESLAAGVVESSLHVVAKGPFETKLDYQPGQARDLEVQLGGDPNRLGALVERRFLRVLSDGEPEPFRQGSGRLELAECLFDEGAALAARVMVNRIWRQHFGSGLVATPSEFGQMGARPTHPELLDDLAARFIVNGWSMKWLHRELVTSATYRQSSRADAARSAVDPDNRWLWRMNRRRLEVESWRDAMLAVSGLLDAAMGGAPMEFSDRENRRRTIYTKVDRRDLEPVLRLYDFPDPSSHSPAREHTTTPLQQLFVLNADFIDRQAEALATRLDRLPGASDPAKVRRAYELLFSRQAAEEEVGWALAYVAAAGEDLSRRDELWREYARVLLGSSEFLFVD